MLVMQLNRVSQRQTVVVALCEAVAAVPVMAPARFGERAVHLCWGDIRREITEVLTLGPRLARSGVIAKSEGGGQTQRYGFCGCCNAVANCF